MEVPYYCTPAILDDLKTSHEWYQVVVQCFSVLCCLMALPFTYWSCHCFEKGYVPKKLKILMYFHHIALLTYSISFLCTQFYHLGSRFFYDDCDLLSAVNRCIYPRLLQSTPSAFFQFFYIAVIINTFMSHFNFWSNNLTRIEGWLTVVLSCAGTYGSYLVDTKSDGYMINCSSFEHKRVQVQIEIFSQFLAVDVVAIVGFSVLAAWQRRLKNNPVLKYSISKKHRARELERTSFLILPNLLLNVICYAVFCVMSLYSASEEKLNANNFLRSNTVPIYVCLSPVIWVKALNRFQAKVTPTVTSEEQYFNHLRQSWNEYGSRDNTRRNVFRRRNNKTSAEPSVSFSVIDPEQIIVHTV